MSNCLHKKIKSKYPKCKVCHKPMTLRKPSYDTKTEELWICERCGWEKFVPKELRGE